MVSLYEDEVKLEKLKKQLKAANRECGNRRAENARLKKRIGILEGVLKELKEA